MYISIDVGGTNMRVALVDLDGKEEITNVKSKAVPQDFNTGIQELMECISEISAGQEIKGIGACFPGILDKDDMITTSNNLPNWAQKPIKQILQKRFQVPVKFIHDVQAAAIGEALFGAARQHDQFDFFIWGDRVLCCGRQKI